MQVKKVLAAEFGSKMVSVVGGRGTATGWCNIEINAGNRLDTTEFYSQRERDLMNNINRKASALLCLADIEFCKYQDDMGGENQECIIQVRLS